MNTFPVDAKKTGIMIAEFTKDCHGTVFYAGHNLKEMINYHPSDLKGQNITRIMPECYQKIHPQIMKFVVVI